MKFPRLLVGTVALVALGGSVAFAAPDASRSPASPRAMHHGDFDGASPEGGLRFRHLVEQLDLSADQKARIGAMVERMRPRMQALHQSGRATREQLASLPPTDPAYASAVAQAKTQAAEWIDVTSDLWAQVYGVLTPEQRARIPDLLAAEREKREARREDWKKRRVGSPG